MEMEAPSDGLLTNSDFPCGNGVSDNTHSYHFHPAETSIIPYLGISPFKYILSEMHTTHSMTSRQPKFKLSCYANTEMPTAHLNDVTTHTAQVN